MLLELLTGIPARFILTSYSMFPWPSVLDYFYLRSRCLQRLFRYHISYPVPVREDPKMSELVQQCGLQFDVHSMTTFDGYCLTLHRVVRGSYDVQPGGKPARKVLLFHGLLQDGESFLAGGRSSLVALLALGANCEVWLANARGSKYSQKHQHYGPNDDRYWNYTLDDMIGDVAQIVDFVLATGSSPHQLVCIGFSQGAAQLCCAVARTHSLNSKISLLVCLAPAIELAGLAPSLLSRVVQRYPRAAGLLFGRRQVFSSVPLWQNILSAPTFASVCVASMRFLFGWTCDQISTARRNLLFQHIYSPASVALVTHWFHIIHNRRIQSITGEPYELGGIVCPVAVFVGENDHLVVNQALARAVPNCVLYHSEAGYEHLDLLWADTAHTEIFPKILSLVEQY